MIEPSSCFFQSLEAQTLQRCFLRMTDARFNFAFAVGILNAARHGHRAVVRQHVAIKRIQRGIVNIGDEHAFAQIVEHDNAGGTAQPTKISPAQLGPDARTGAEGQQTNRLAVQLNVITNSRVRRYFRLSGSRTMVLVP